MSDTPSQIKELYDRFPKTATFLVEFFTQSQKLGLPEGMTPEYHAKVCGQSALLNLLVLQSLNKNDDQVFAQLIGCKHPMQISNALGVYASEFMQQGGDLIAVSQQVHDLNEKAHNSLQSGPKKPLERGDANSRDDGLGRR